MATKEYNNEVVFFTEEKKDDNDMLALLHTSSSTSFDVNIIEQDDSVEEDQEKNKTVKFADVEAEKFDAQRDQERSRQELLVRIARLTETLKDAQQEIKMEKDKRKKKEKSLLKLAKELKKRNLLKEQNEDRFEELDEKRKYLEHHWVLAQKELDQEKALHAKIHEETEKEYEHNIKEEKGKYERTVKENEKRLEDLKKAHMEQCAQLGREAWKANLEADRLHEELTARGLNVPRRLMEGEDYHVDYERSRLRTFLVIFAVVSSIVYSYIGKNARDIFTHSGLCAPLIPGTILDDNSYGTFRAPWWVPGSLKEQAFTAACTEGGWDKAMTKAFTNPPSLEWAREAKNNRMVVLSSEGKVMLKKTIAKAEIASRKVKFWKRNGGSEEVPLDWLSMN